jgi:hypothetical protein
MATDTVVLMCLGQGPGPARGRFLDGRSGDGSVALAEHPGSEGVPASG